MLPLLLAALLTGNWAVRDPLPDGTVRRTYYDLKQEGTNITGHIRMGPYHFTVVKSSGGPENFTLTGSMPDGLSVRTQQFTGKLVGDDELHVSYQRRNNTVEQVAHRAPAGEGAMPARIPPPALHPVPSNGLAQTPPMGWNSWNKFAGRVDDAGVRATADAIASNGMKEAGYVYVNIDDTWQGERDSSGVIHANKKFPDMKALADYVHGKGLKIGIYSSPGPNTCAGYEGSYGHEAQDARTYAEWGMDYLKYDWCGARNIYKDDEMQAVYQIMGDALVKSGRPILYSLCQYGRDDVWKWGPQVSGNAWRTTGDISDNWNSMSKIGFSQSDIASYAGPGHWNDPDMLEIGNGGMTDTEYRTHMTLWALLAAPLLAGNDLSTMTPQILAILTNKDVIAIDQDRAGKAATRRWKEGDQEIWARPLASGEMAVGIFNRGTEAATVQPNWSKVGLHSAPSKAEDLWEHKPVANLSGIPVPGHGVVLLRVSGS